MNAFSQNTDSTGRADSAKTPAHFSAAVAVTNKGISLVPTFTLGKPAIIFNMNLGKRKLSFEPELRFALEGKPWSFLFWWRYKLLKTKKISVRLGAHPALNFRTESVSVNGTAKDVIVSRRYLAAELVPNFQVSKNVSVGFYYLYSRCLEKDAARNTHFLTVNSNISNIKLGRQLFARFTPQLYYLKQDKLDGFYITSSLTLAHRKFPVAVQYIVNKTIRSDIKSQNFVWNLSLIYTFDKKYLEK
jgi:hypothetical protein